MMIDTHCHLSKADYNNLDEVINKMDKNIMIASGSTQLSNEEVLKLCHEHKNIYGTIGIHPNELNGLNQGTYDFLENHIADPKIVGIGEIGLDYHWFSDNKDAQKEAFIKQVAIAKKHKKSFVIHSRDANDDVYKILKDNYYPGMKAVMHCYSGNLELANELIKLNVKLGISGVITFKNADKLRDVVKNIGLEHLLLETDSPYLSPEPYRGQKNEPINLFLIAQKVAEIKGLSVDEVIEITTANAISQFDLKV